MENAEETHGTLGNGLRYFGADLNDLAGTEKAVSVPKKLVALIYWLIMRLC